MPEIAPHQVRALILAEDPAEIRRMEALIGITQAQAVNAVATDPFPSDPMARLLAAREVVREPFFDPSLLSPLENNLMFALAYVMTFINDTTEDGNQAKKLAEDNLKAAREK